MPGAEAIAERPDGTRVPFAPYPKLLRNAEGEITGAVNVLVELSDRHEAHINAERLAAIVASSDDAIVSKDLNSIVRSWNRGAERIFGYRADEMIGQSILKVIPDYLQHEEAEIISKLKQGERIDHYDTIRVTKDGREVQLSITVSPIRDRAGKIVGASKVARDITQRKQDEAFQHLLVQELNHRVKNSLAIIQSLASQSLRLARSPEHFTESFTGRVQALAKAHDLLVRQRIAGISLQELVREQVLLGQPDIRIAASGPEVIIEGRDALNLGLVLHELATNAQKYGALSSSCPAGHLEIRWDVIGGTVPELELNWRESGVSGIELSEHKGFGTRLIERSLAGTGGEVLLNMAVDGLHCSIRLPLERAGAVSMGKATSGAARRAKRILVIEDEPLISMELEQLLISTGFTVVGPVGTVSKALEAVAIESFDAALLDANLGGQPVDEIAAALTQKNVPFAFATGHDRDGLPRRYAAAPILRKPFNPAEVIATVSEILTPETLWRRTNKL